MWKKDDPDHQGDSWYSHKDGDAWCNGKPKFAPKVGSGFNQEREALTGKVLAAIVSQLNRIEAKIDAMTPAGVTVEKPTIKTGPMPF